MEVMLSYKLEDFEGPLDLMLQLIAKNKLNINDIKLTLLIDQYLEHIEKMQITEDMDVASDFLQMASRLIYIKTVSLLPKHEEIEQLKEQLTGELIEYQICREAAKKLADISEINCEKVYWIQTLRDLKNETFDVFKKVGIVAGASTPSDIIEEVKNFLERVN